MPNFNIQIQHDIARIAPGNRKGRCPLDGYVRGCGLQFGNIAQLCQQDPDFGRAYQLARPRSAVSDPNIVALASSSAASVAAPQILLGFVDFPVFLSNGTEHRNFHVTLRNVDSLPGMATATNLTLRVERIPDTEESALSQLQQVGDIPVTVSGGVIDVDRADAGGRSCSRAKRSF